MLCILAATPLQNLRTVQRISRSLRAPMRGLRLRTSASRSDSRGSLRVRRPFSDFDRESAFLCSIVNPPFEKGWIVRHRWLRGVPPH
jgi:hypothetical protein